MTNVLLYYKTLSELNKRDEGMGDYEKGRQDCEAGIPHKHKSEAYTNGYGDQYAKEQAQ